MKFIVFVSFLIVIMVVTAGALTSVLFCFDPFASGGLIFVLFYSALFLFLSSFFSLIIFLVKRSLTKKEDWQLVHGSVRQGFLLAILGNAILCLQKHQWLSWATLLIVMLVLAGFEFFFKYRRR